MKKKHVDLQEQPLGAHLSISGGFDKMVRDGESIDCTAIAMFLHSNRQWAMKDLSEQARQTFLTAAAHSSIKDYVVHSSYLVNLGSPNTAIRQKSLHMLAKELHQCEQLLIPSLVLHPGSYAGTTPEKCIALIAEGLDVVFEMVPGKSSILIENTAGQGSAVGATLEELALIRKQVHHKARLGICFDTCHGFAAGYDFTTQDTYNKFWQHFDKIVGTEQVKTFHVNDSKRELGSRIDRHEQIGKGKMGIEPFKLLVNDERFAHIPKILETPYTDYKKDALKLYSQNLILLRSLIKN